MNVVVLPGAVLTRTTSNQWNRCWPNTACRCWSPASGPPRLHPFCGQRAARGSVGGRWWHYRQNKHHRWFLDGSQIPGRTTSSAPASRRALVGGDGIPERSMHLLDVVGGITVAAVVCEDLARIDGWRIYCDRLVRLWFSPCYWTGRNWPPGGRPLCRCWPTTRARRCSLTALGMATRSATARDASQSRRRHVEGPVPRAARSPRTGRARLFAEGGSGAESARYAADGRQPVDDVADLHRMSNCVPTRRVLTAQQQQAPGAAGDQRTHGHVSLGASGRGFPGIVDRGGNSCWRPETRCGWRTVGRLAQPTGELAAALCALANCTTSALASDEGFATALDLVVPRDDLQAVAQQTLMAALEASRS